MLILPKGLYCIAYGCPFGATDHHYCSDHFGNIELPLRYEFLNAKAEADRLGRVTNRLRVALENVNLHLARKDREKAVAAEKAARQAALEESQNKETELFIESLPIIRSNK